MIHLLDCLHLGKPGAISTALIETSTEELILVDSGPETVFETTVQSIRDLGFDPKNVRHLLITHIHLDHSGGAWRWAREYGTTLYVHPRGAPHLIKPEKLVASAAKIFGDKMKSLGGTTEGTPAEKVSAVDDRDVLNLGGVSIEVVEALGHAQHHHAYWLPQQKALFAGDVAGVSIGHGPLIPPCPPPDLHLEAWKLSLEKIRALAPNQLYVTHFGEVTDYRRRLDELETRLNAWANWMKDQLIAHVPEDQLVPRFEQYVIQDLLSSGVQRADIDVYEQVDPASMSVTGLVRYWRKYHPELVGKLS